MSGENLSGVKLGNADKVDANFTGATLTRANLLSADQSRVNLT
jgi:uncharacterized protein YjbI with pentapeptide repeats